MSVTISGTSGISIGGDPVATDADLAALVTGKVLQVVSTAKTNTFVTTSGSYDGITGLSVSITPSAADSKVYLVASINFSQYGIPDNRAAPFRFTGGNTASYRGASPGSRQPAAGALGNFGPNASEHIFTLAYLDSPASTSSITYGVEVRTLNSTYPIYVNRGITDTNDGLHVRTASSITAFEVAA